MLIHNLARANSTTLPGPLVVFSSPIRPVQQREPVRSGPEAVAPGSTSDGQVSIHVIWRMRARFRVTCSVVVNKKIPAMYL